MLSLCVATFRRAAPVLSGPSRPGLSQFSTSITALADKYDMVVIGGGSGGIAAARRAASHGAKVAVVENKKLGGTCVNVGCVPKKVTFNAAEILEMSRMAPEYGFEFPGGTPKLNMAVLKDKRDAFVRRLNDIYFNNLESSDVARLVGKASLSSTPGEVVINGEEVIQADHIAISTGGFPFVPPVPGVEHTITSDGFFDLDEIPQSIAVVGGGYIAVEMTGILAALGAETHTIIRGPQLLQNFDSMLSSELTSALSEYGHLVTGTNVERIELRPDGKRELTLMSNSGSASSLVVDQVLYATGRQPAVQGLGLEAAGVSQDKSGFITVDDQQNTNVRGVYALGDVCGRLALTPVAVAAGRLLADRLFAGRSDAMLDYDGVPTVIFSHPTIGTIGLSEEAAVEEYGRENIRVYSSKFVNMIYSLTTAKPKTAMKVVCAGDDEKVVGLHVIGRGADEMLQGFGVAFKMGMTKADLDRCVAIHPTAAEEFVTLPPWNPPPSSA